MRFYGIAMFAVLFSAVLISYNYIGYDSDLSSLKPQGMSVQGDQGLVSSATSSLLNDGEFQDTDAQDTAQRDNILEKSSSFLSKFQKVVTFPTLLKQQFGVPQFLTYLLAVGISTIGLILLIGLFGGNSTGENF